MMACSGFFTETILRDLGMKWQSQFDATLCAEQLLHGSTEGMPKPSTPLQAAAVSPAEVETLPQMIRLAEDGSRIGLQWSQKVQDGVPVAGGENTAARSPTLESC